MIENSIIIDNHVLVCEIRVIDNTNLFYIHQVNLYFHDVKSKI
jgi:hypothetical protein